MGNPYFSQASGGGRGRDACCSSLQSQMWDCQSCTDSWCGGSCCSCSTIDYPGGPQYVCHFTCYGMLAACCSAGGGGGTAPHPNPQPKNTKKRRGGFAGYRRGGRIYRRGGKR